ncbi:hypothetical protein AB5J62_22640 [Amycolatopsis sp. cg5]|uniref:hypothetical protein n=1 Tax=Amycolatopsis sp. cg5 TaxID=3238802 RepID=UPI0035243107
MGESVLAGEAGRIGDGMREDGEPADEVVAAALHSLPPRWRAVLRGTVADGHTSSELAPALGSSPKEVTALAARAREALRRAYLEAQRFPETQEHR